MTTRPTPRRARGRRGSLLLVAGAALLAGAAGAGGTVALWQAAADLPLGAITAGNLDIDTVGETVWHDTSPDVPGTPRRIDPASFLARPGDSLLASQRLTTELEGDNMRGRLTVGWEREPVLPEGVRATYSVRDAAGDPLVSDVPLGEDRLVALDDDGRVLTVEVAITLGEGTKDRVGADAAAQLTDLGTVVVDLEQVRSGEGFAS
ncbi:alternate signal-mediated exported protein, RER_14450 family [Georgenia satyanarayanai]|uniref:Alternate signal-mediated exported protein, RER_14450 family n=1 Tax=Georgenia satyanarayanai TaxID=860221 RepID=A0A2Y9AGZ2_9MICO|nr:alternate-type signal peptide domain-containing protein [Georgenia satyanarayanai]PYF99683.1 alternate signal-mediated exported protein [Georgenia satyanarayanai]SSA42528.1 alternate signal-mediated exported protein, RER_14450 family [Georgenia satyanarayanai]